MSTRFSAIRSIEETKQTIPQILYKYRNWNEDEKSKFHKTLLTHQQLFFSAPDSFEDPFDCRFPVEFDFSFDSLYASMKASYYNANGLHVMKDNQLKAVIEFLYEERFGDDKKRLEREKEFYKIFNSTLSIYCLSKSCQSFEMWQKYGDNFKGFCIGYNLQNNFQSLVDAYIAGGGVKYIDDKSIKIPYKSIYNQQNVDDSIWFFLDLVMTKYHSWSFEDEYRLFKINFDELNYHNVPKFNNIFTVPNECFAEIIFGFEMEQKYKDEIYDICAVNKLPVTFKVAKLENNKIIIEAL